MRSKRTWILSLCILLAASLAISGTLAFLTDTETEVNVFTMGNVDIELNEEFEQESALNPGIKVDKVATIENVGANAAWVWFTYAVPADVDPALIVELGNTPWQDKFLVEENKEIDGVLYNVYGLLYDNMLQPGAETTPGMLSVTLSGNVDFQDGKYVLVQNGQITELTAGSLDQVKVILSAYAIQTDGFDTVEEGYDAYNAQWGEAVIPGLAVDVPSDAVKVGTLDELKAAFAAGGNYEIIAPIYVDSTITASANTYLYNTNPDNIITMAPAATITVGSKVTLEGYGVIVDNGQSYSFEDGVFTLSAE